MYSTCFRQVVQTGNSGTFCGVSHPSALFTVLHELTAMVPLISVFFFARFLISGLRWASYCIRSNWCFWLRGESWLDLRERRSVDRRGRRVGCKQAELWPHNASNAVTGIWNGLGLMFFSALCCTWNWQPNLPCTRSQHCILSWIVHNAWPDSPKFGLADVEISCPQSYKCWNAIMFIYNMFSTSTWYCACQKVSGINE